MTTLIITHIIAAVTGALITLAVINWNRIVKAFASNEIHYVSDEEFQMIKKQMVEYDCPGEKFGKEQELLDPEERRLINDY